jgi:HEAT repeat protein
VKWANKESVPALLAAINSTDGEVRKKAMEALGALKDPRGAAPIAARLADFFDRAAAAQALCLMGETAEEAVAEWVKAPDGATSTEACKVLGKIGTKKSVPLLNLLVQRGGFAVREAARQALIGVVARLTPEEKASLSKPTKSRR